MSSIKRFDDYSYKELTRHEYLEEFCRIVQFDKKEIIDIESYLCRDLPPSCNVKYTTNNVHIFSKVDGSYSNAARQIEVKKDDVLYTITKKFDEWYLIEEIIASDRIYVNRKGKYYICDQFDELIKFFKDKNLLSVNESVNESVSSNDTWVVILTTYDGDIEDVSTYKTELSAANHYINLVNELFHQEFEPMMENGERLFVDANDNEDYSKAIKYVNDQGNKLNGPGVDYWPWIYKTKTMK